jgi:glycosyltransferase involved in cell wall biosynthesis
VEISVIMPVYNGQAYLDQAVRSVQKQDTDWELWLVDDGSTDASPQMCDEYARKDTRIHVIHKTNEGPGLARNAAIEQAKGEYFLFLDCDDWLTDGAMPYLYQLAKRQEADIICYSIHKTTSRQEEVLPQPEEQLLIYEGSDVLRRYFTQMTASICKLFHRHIFDNCRFEKVALSEDAWSMHIFFSKAKKLVLTNRICYVQYFRDNSRSRENFSEKNFIYEECGKRMVTFAAECFPELYGEALFNLIRRQLKLLYLIVESGKYMEYRAQYVRITQELKQEKTDAAKYRAIHEPVWKRLCFAADHPFLNRCRDRAKTVRYRGKNR